MDIFDIALMKKFGGGSGSGGSGGGSDGGGADIDVTAEAGQIIRVKAVDADGKPTEWESAEYPVGAKIYTVSDIKKKTMEELRAEYDEHPIILRCATASMSSGDILLHKTSYGFIGGAIGDNHYGISVNVDTNTTNGKLKVEEWEWTVPFMSASSAREGFAYRNDAGGWGTQSIDYIKEHVKPDIAVVELPIEYLTDGATLPIDYEDYISILTKYGEIPIIIIRAVSDTAQVDLNVLRLSMDMSTGVTSVRVLSPTTNDIITINFALAG